MGANFRVRPSPGPGGGELSPGSGSTGFAPDGIVRANSSGQLTNSTGVLLTTNGNIVAETGSALSIFTNDAQDLRLGADASYRWRILGVSPYSFVPLANNGSDLGQPGRRVRSGYFGTDVQVHDGTNPIVRMTTAGFRVDSTSLASTSVGTTGAAAAPPATPQVYLKVVAPDGTTVYVPGYAST